jgi:hypothetical protein
MRPKQIFIVSATEVVLIVEIQVFLPLSTHFIIILELFVIVTQNAQSTRTLAV